MERQKIVISAREGSIKETRNRVVFQSKGMWNVRDVEDAQGRELGTELDSVFFLSFL